MVRVLVRVIQVIFLSNQYAADCKPTCNGFLHKNTNGFAGGALLRKSNGSLIGITSFMDGEYDYYPITITLNAFTRIHTYYDWIAEITGLNMPICGN